MGHNGEMIDEDVHFKIDGKLRVIKNSSRIPQTLVQGDHNSEKFTFELPRYIDGHDMLECNVVQIHYLNIDSSTRETYSGLYEVKGLFVNPDDDETVIFTWLVSRYATQYAGSLNFAIRFACVDSDVVEYELNTTIYRGIAISKGIRNMNHIVEDYSDILEQWRQELFGSIPTIEATETETGVTIVIKDADGTQEVHIKNGTGEGIPGPQGPKGDPGVTPEFEIRDGRLIAKYEE